MLCVPPFRDHNRSAPPSGEVARPFAPGFFFCFPKSSVDNLDLLPGDDSLAPHVHGGISGCGRPCLLGSYWFGDDIPLPPFPPPFFRETPQIPVPFFRPLKPGKEFVALSTMFRLGPPYERTPPPPRDFVFNDATFFFPLADCLPPPSPPT